MYDTQTGPYHPTCLVCNKCKKPVVDYYTNRARADPKMYCCSCFVKYFARKCAECKNGIDDVGFYNAMGKYFHSAHFRCYECHLQLSTADRFWNVGGKPFCRLHYEHAKGYNQKKPPTVDQAKMVSNLMEKSSRPPPVRAAGCPQFKPITPLEGVRSPKQVDKLPSPNKKQVGNAAMALNKLVMPQWEDVPKALKTAVAAKMGWAPAYDVPKSK